MIKVIDGDLFDSTARFIVHQVNCQGRIGSGVALQVKQKFPHVFEEYKKVCSNNMLGEIQIVSVNPNDVGILSGSIFLPQSRQFIVNAFAQDKYGYDGKMYTSLDALQSCFNKIHARIHERNNNNNATIAMPYKIGCCRGGADWNVVYQMIDTTFRNHNVELWRLDKG